MITDEHISLLSERYMIDAKWVRQLRDMDFLLSYADVPEEQHEQLNQIQWQLKEDAWILTQVVFPKATRDDYGLLSIENTLLCSLSEYWWQLIAQKAEETKALKKSWEKQQ